MLTNFTYSRSPKIVFGVGETNKLGLLTRSFGQKALIVRGASIKKNIQWDSVKSSLVNSQIDFIEYEVSGEPSPKTIDTAVMNYKDAGIHCVIAIGGGSALDAGKAISAMLPSGKPIKVFLEIVGTCKPDGIKIPFIAVPTTSGTGSEASANAVISEIGIHGFKRSLRHENYVPDIALVDPNLTVSCPATITASCGMDALTQLLESFVSPKSSPFTDALIESAFPLIGSHLVNAVKQGTTNIAARTGMAYASLVSGICLGNAGLGIVHGLAAVLGAMYPIPHGVVCGTLLASSVKMNISKLVKTNPDSVFLRKYAIAGNLLLQQKMPTITDAYMQLVNYLDSITLSLDIPLLSDYGVKTADFEVILRENCHKNNPVILDNSEIIELLASRMK